GLHPSLHECDAWQQCVYPLCRETLDGFHFEINCFSIALPGHSANHVALSRCLLCLVLHFLWWHLASVCVRLASINISIAAWCLPCSSQLISFGLIHSRMA